MPPQRAPAETQAADPISIALDAAVVAHELAGVRERKRYARDLLAAIDESLAKLARDKEPRH